MNTTRTLLLSLATASIALAGCSSEPDITGRWASEGVETRSGANNSKLYLRRDFQTTDTHSAARFDFFADEAGTQPTVSVWLNGPYTLTQPWDAVPGAYAGEFTFTALKITPRASGMVDYLNSSAAGTCGSKPFTLDVEQDVSDTGCLALGIDLKNKPTEYDIVKREGDKLYYGARPTDGSGLDSPEKRPTALQVPVVLVK
ncbi:MAG TPA: hypothetical protein VF664_11375 [Cystobacter sp.]|jgi:hypothetical protein